MMGCRRPMSDPIGDIFLGLKEPKNILILASLISRLARQLLAPLS